MEDLPDLAKHKAKKKQKQKPKRPKNPKKLQRKTLLNLNIRPTANTFYYNPYLQYNYI